MDGAGAGQWLAWRSRHGRYVRSANAGVAAPVEDGQEDHVEGVRAQVGRDGEVGVEGGRAQLLLHQGEVGRLPAHDGEQGIADLVAPRGQASRIWGDGLATRWARRSGTRRAHSTVVVVLVARIEPRLLLRRRALSSSSSSSSRGGRLGVGGGRIGSGRALGRGAVFTAGGHRDGRV